MDVCFDEWLGIVCVNLKFKGVTVVRLLQFDSYIVFFSRWVFTKLSSFALIYAWDMDFF